MLIVQRRDVGGASSHYRILLHPIYTMYISRDFHRAGSSMPPIHWCNQWKNVRCQRMPFCGLSTQ